MSQLSRLRRLLIPVTLVWGCAFLAFLLIYLVPRHLLLSPVTSGAPGAPGTHLHNQTSLRHAVTATITPPPRPPGINDVNRGSGSGDLAAAVTSLNYDPRLPPRAETLQEFEYEPFDMDMPLFTDESDEKIFKAGVCHTEFLSNYQGEDKLRGKIVLIRNGMYRMPYDCGYMSDLEPLLRVPDTKFPVTRYDKLIIMIIPDGWSFQHFLDGTLPKLVQALPVIRRTPGMKLLLDREPRDKLVFEILQKLGFNIDDDIVYARRNVIVANELYSSCWTPPLHPKLWQESQRLIGVYGPDPLLDQLVPQDKVIFINRNPKNSFNKGRMALNHEEVVAFLGKRYGDRFLSYDSRSAAGSLNNTVEMFRRARVIVGVHGGGMFNLQFARRGAHVVEVVPVFRDGRYVLPRCMVYVVAELVGQHYWHVTMTTARNNGDLNIDVAKLARTLDAIDSLHVT